ncbi:hypothetical protein ACFL6I_26370 [candidate division KSB1 bacterium]
MNLMKGYDQRFGKEPKDNKSTDNLSSLKNLAVGLVVLAIVLALI